MRKINKSCLYHETINSRINRILSLPRNVLAFCCAQSRLISAFGRVLPMRILASCRVRSRRALILCCAMSSVIALTACGDEDEEELIALGDNAIRVEYEEHMLDGSCSTAEQTLYSGEISVIGPDAHIDTVCVHVCGAVAIPGVYEMTAGSRVVEAIYAAGGFLPDAASDALNLALDVVDGEQIYVPTVEEVGNISDGVRSSDASNQANHAIFTPTGTSDARTQNQSASGSLININTADRSLLMTLTGIGESKADSIISYREANGAFSRIEDIMLVPGIKERLFNKIKDNICVR